MSLAGLTLGGAARALAAGAVSSRELVEQALAAIEADPRAFTRIRAAEARAAADAQDTLRAAGAAPSPLAGAPVSIKDLFDVAGETTAAGSVALAQAPPAQADAPVVRRLKAAGLVLIGRTQMSEFAFTGLGLNPHAAQPVNPADPSRAPGGSSGGAAVSVGLGQALAGLGTDTGGSVRIPAAFCGLVGLKPTQARVSRQGVFPLAASLDSVGPIAATVQDCALIDAVIADAMSPPHPPLALAGLRLGVSETWFLDDLEPAVASAFEAALSALAKAGARIEHVALPELARLPQINRVGSIANAEAFAFHRRTGLLERRALYDPNVLTRIEVGAGMGAADYLDLLESRAELIAAADRLSAGFDALVAPTSPILAPRLADLTDPAAFSRLNGLALRNASVINLLDRCAVSLPIGAAHPPVGLMLIGERAGDARLLALGAAAEPVVASAGAGGR